MTLCKWFSGCHSVASDAKTPLTLLYIYINIYVSFFKVNIYCFLVIFLSILSLKCKKTQIAVDTEANLLDFCLLVQIVSFVMPDVLHYLYIYFILA